MEAIPQSIEKKWTKILRQHGVHPRVAKKLPRVIAGDPRLTFREVVTGDDAKTIREIVREILHNTFENKDGIDNPDRLYDELLAVLAKELPETSRQGESDYSDSSRLAEPKTIQITKNCNEVRVPRNTFERDRFNSDHPEDDLITYRNLDAGEKFIFANALANEFIQRGIAKPYAEAPLFGETEKSEENFKAQLVSNDHKKAIDQRVRPSWSMNDSRTLLETLAVDGARTPLKKSKLPEWANPEKREENYHHALRRLFESSKWDIFGYGPVGNIGGEVVDIVLDVASVEAEDEIIETEREFIGIEVTSEADLFETTTNNLEQLKRQTRMRALDRLYVCTPDSERETWLDCNLEDTKLDNHLIMAPTSRAFKGITGTIRQSDGQENPKIPYYNRLRSQDTQKLVEELERQGDSEQVKLNLEEIEGATLSDESGKRNDEWVDSMLQKIGIIRFDTDTGEMRVTQGAERLERTRPPSCIHAPEDQESDVVHAVWHYFINQPGTDVCVEVELPSIRDIRETRASSTSSLRFTNYFDREVWRSASRIDLVVAREEELRGIEVKGKDSNWNDLIHVRLPAYTAVTELDAVDVAVLANEAETARENIEREFPEVGLLSVSNPRGRPVIERIR